MEYIRIRPYNIFGDIQPNIVKNNKISGITQKATIVNIVRETVTDNGDSVITDDGSRYEREGISSEVYSTPSVSNYITKAVYLNQITVLDDITTVEINSENFIDYDTLKVVVGYNIMDNNGYVSGKLNSTTLYKTLGKYYNNYKILRGAVPIPTSSKVDKDSSNFQDLLSLFINAVSSSMAYSINNKSDKSCQIQIYNTGIMGAVLRNRYITGNLPLIPPKDPSFYSDVDGQKETKTNYPIVPECYIEEITISFEVVSSQETTIETIGQSPYIEKENNQFTRTDIYSDSDSSNALYSVMNNDLIQEWKNGKQTLELLCSIDNYYYDDYDGNNNMINSRKAISLEESILDNFGENKMTFEQGDVVKPYIKDGSGKEIPLSYNTNGEAVAFKVVGNRAVYDGACWQKLTLLEYKE